MPVRQSTLPPCPPLPSPSRFPYSRNPSALHRRSTTSPFPPPPRRAFYRRLCVLRQWQTDLNLPLRPYRQPSIPSFYLSRRGRPPFNDVTGCPTLRFTKFIYRSSRILYIYICVYACIFVYNVVSITNDQHFRVSFTSLISLLA